MRMEPGAFSTTWWARWHKPSLTGGYGIIPVALLQVRQTFSWLPFNEEPGFRHAIGRLFAT